MGKPSLRRAFWLGVRDGLPFVVLIVPFGLLFGVVAGEAGWSLLQIVSMSVLVVAGASQFTALQLLGDHAPAIVAIVAGLAVNLRLAMYSASLAPHIGGVRPWQRMLAAYALTDQNYGAAMNRYTVGPTMSAREKLAHFFGASLVICVPWPIAGWVGAVTGTAIPAGLALDFVLPITFLALFGPALRSLPYVAAAVVSVVVALALAWMPYNLWLIVAAIAAMATGAAVEAWQERP